MAKVYLVNVGANLADAGVARSPVFGDGSFEFVSFPDNDSPLSYPESLRPFVKLVAIGTHLDPDWDNHTYGDYCGNPRARALLSVQVGDVLLFWGLLWRVANRSDSVWATRDRGWFLLGALRVAHVLRGGEGFESLAPSERQRVADNAHVRGQKVDPERPQVRVFLGDLRASIRFPCAVDLGVYEPRSLLREVVRTKDGRLIQWHTSPRWNSVTRSCRPILDLMNLEDRPRAKVLGDHINMLNPGYDLLAGLVS